MHLPLLLRQRFISICFSMIHWDLTSALQLMADGHYCRLIVNSCRLCFAKFLIVIKITILIICTITIIVIHLINIVICCVFPSKITYIFTYTPPPLKSPNYKRHNSDTNIAKRGMKNFLFAYRKKRAVTL